MRMTSLALIIGLGFCATACVLPPRTIDLERVAADNGLKNVTTGDGDFDNYMATNYTTETEIGFGLGFPFFKMFEVWPAYSNEQLMGQIAKETVAAGGDAMINVTPTQESFYGFMFGMYIDYTEGTGIKTR